MCTHSLGTHFEDSSHSFDSPGLSSLYLVNSAGLISISRCWRGSDELGVGAGLWWPDMPLLGLAGPPAPLSSSSCRMRRTLGERIVEFGPPMCCVDSDRTGTDDITRLEPMLPPMCRSSVPPVMTPVRLL